VTVTFDEDVDTWVLAAVRAGPTSFDDVVCHLPGVYPTDAVASLERLHRRGAIGPDECNRALSRRPTTNRFRPNTALPLPHPLDFDWRFAPEALDQLLAACGPDDDAGLACLGAPSVLHRLLMTDGRAATLLDANPAIIHALHATGSRHSARLCRLATDPLPDLRVATVLIDPPWYPEHFRVFLWAASEMCIDGGRVLVGFPPAGTRPGVASERDEAIDYARTAGLALAEIRRGSLPYASPPFEQASLATAGWPQLPADWRRGDLLVLEARTNRRRLPAPPAPAEDLEWTEVPVAGTRLKVRNRPRQDGQKVSPTLRSIVDGDVLPTVSRRDPRRADAVLWSATNRVFACEDAPMLAEVVRARAAGTATVDVVARAVARDLSPAEEAAVRETEEQLDELVHTEVAELDAYGWKVG
jgi:hypothetical protein